MGASQMKFLEGFPTSVWAPIFNLFEDTRQHGGERTSLWYIFWLNMAASILSGAQRSSEGNAHKR